MTTEPVETPPALDTKVQTRFTYLGLVGLAVLGSLLAVLPHLVTWIRSGDLAYIADGDQILYMAWSRSAVLEGSWTLTDAVHPMSGPMMHPRALFIPAAQLARLLHLDTIGLAIVWRVFGGAGVALGLFAAIRPMVRSHRLALGLATLLLFDAGFLFGTPLLRQFDVLSSIVRGSDRYFEAAPRVMAHLRVVPPAFVLPFLLAHLGLIVQARKIGSATAAIGAGLALGAMFHLYFYYWTMVSPALALAFLVDPKGRRSYAIALGIGLILGFPAVLDASRAKADNPPDWLLRTDKFVPIGHFQELLTPKVVIGLLSVSAPLAFLRRRELAPVWCAGVAGLICMNHQVVTGLQIENFHWLNGLGPSVSLLVVGLAAPYLFEPEGRPPRLRFLAVCVILQVLAGFHLRWQETVKTAQTERWARVDRAFKSDDPPISAGSVLAGDPDGVMLMAGRRIVYPLAGKFVEYCSRVTDVELDERLMLNLCLSGLDEESARREVEKPAGTLSWEAQATRSEHESVASTQRARRLSLIDRIWEDPRPWVARFGVTQVLVPRANALRAKESTIARAGGGERVFEGKDWQPLEHGSPTR